jgi:F-type H+-transporting ATPase subunit epsilon
MATFHLDLVAPDALTFAGEVDQVDLPGLEGDFGVLAAHAPMVALLRPGIVTIHSGGSQSQIVVFGGFAEVSAGTLTVLADVATPIEDFDRAVLSARISEMEQKVEQMEPGSLLDRAIQQLDHFKAVDSHLVGTAMH